jgi:hypothetical protein
MSYSENFDNFPRIQAFALGSSFLGLRPTMTVCRFIWHYLGQTLRWRENSTRMEASSILVNDSMLLGGLSTSKKFR